VSHTLVLPADVNGLPNLTAKIYSNPLDSLIDAVESLIRDPYGCFEQTSSTTYPMVMGLRLLIELESKLSDATEKKRVVEMKDDMQKKLTAGYERLIGFETDTFGYEWFGASPGHETLTAYGLMQFIEMKDVGINVDQEMIERTDSWLRGRSEKGEFQLNPR